LQHCDVTSAEGVACPPGVQGCLSHCSCESHYQRLLDGTAVCYEISCISKSVKLITPFPNDELFQILQRR